MTSPARTVWSAGQQLSLTLTQPRDLWGGLDARTIQQGLLLQWFLLSLAKLIALPETMDLAHFAEGKPATPIGMADVALLLFGAALVVAAANFALAGLLCALSALLGKRLELRDALFIAAIALLPLVLGRAAGLAILAIYQPLSLHSPSDLWAWRLWPFSTGLATWLPHPPPALSLGWAFLSVLDVFGFWTLWLAYGGLARALDAPRALRPWLGVLLVLLCCAIALGLWQLGQFWLARTS
jgi:hypothetical protein